MSDNARENRYDRQERLRVIGADGQARLRASRVLIVGCGALGTPSAEYLARAGIGSLRLVDRDIVEWSNLQRQIGFREADAIEGRPKALALAEHLRAVNSEIEIDAHPTELRHENARDLVRDVDLILDATDNLPTRFLVNDLSLALSIPWVYGGAIELGGHVLAISGKAPPCLRCYLPDLPPAGTLATCDTAGVLGSAASSVASLQTALAIRILATAPEPSGAPFGQLYQLDVWNASWRSTRVPPDDVCPTCAEKRFEFLDGIRGDDQTELCGRGAIQVRPSTPPGAPVDLEPFAQKLAGLGDLERRRHYLRLRSEEFSMTLFTDLRAIFDGLTDSGRARSLYSRLVGE